MREERLLSVGIDIGTSTTQCAFSALTLQNMASSFSIPRIQITEKTVLYRAPLRLTPLSSPDTIDTEALKAIVLKEYQAAGISPGDIRLGAVIITGETARKQNARNVAQALSKLAGEFVVATAGPALESILAGRGSGAAELSRSSGKAVLNLDIGGGTTNMALFVHGEPAANGCLDIGGRLIRFEPDAETVLAFAPAMEKLARDVGVSLAHGRRLVPSDQDKLARRMAGVLEEAAGLRPRTALHDALTVDHSLPAECTADLYTFSGGVADCVYGGGNPEVPFYDLGEALGRAVAASLFFGENRVLRPAETQHATVIGAGAYSMAVSGSTIFHQGMTFPLPSLPAGKVLFTDAGQLEGLEERIAAQYDMLDGECALCMDGLAAPSYQVLEEVAVRIARAMASRSPKVLILRHDMAKALGQALSRIWGKDTPFLCIDGISLSYGDMVDIGAPLSGGRIVPVIVKTLAFSH